MSLDEAAELFVPIVSELGNATMQDLEDATGLGRRKLRFHIGQLVRNDCLERHGMGRGTYYTAP
jgi:predicted HTH transcriptional regulator